MIVLSLIVPFQYVVVRAQNMTVTVIWTRHVVVLKFSYLLCGRIYPVIVWFCLLYEWCTHNYTLQWKCNYVRIRHYYISLCKSLLLSWQNMRNIKFHIYDFVELNCFAFKKNKLQELNTMWWVKILSNQFYIFFIHNLVGILFFHSLS